MVKIPLNKVLGNYGSHQLRPVYGEALGKALVLSESQFSHLQKKRDWVIASKSLATSGIL